MAMVAIGNKYPSYGSMINPNAFRKEKYVDGSFRSCCLLLYYLVQNASHCDTLYLEDSYALPSTPNTDA